MRNTRHFCYLVLIYIQYCICQRDHPGDTKQEPVNYTNPIKIHIPSFLSQNVNKTIEERNKLREAKNITNSFNNDIDMKFNRI